MFVTVTWGHYSLAVVFSGVPPFVQQLHACSVTPAGIGQTNRRVQPELKHAKGSKAQSFKPQTQNTTACSLRMFLQALSLPSEKGSNCHAWDQRSHVGSLHE